MNDFTILKDSNDLDDESRLLLEKAKDSLQHAYAPYSNFHVATAILLSDGSIVTGTNQENAAYPSGMCAERVALFTAAAQYPGTEIKKIVVVARFGNQTTLAPATSCGPCRQVMLEFEQRQRKPIEIIMQNQDRQWVKAKSAGSLLPFCFSPENLQVRK
jgi:cytidine deaminase